MSELKSVLKIRSANYSRNINKLAKSGKFLSQYRVLRIGWEPCHGKCDVKGGTLYFGFIDDVGLFCGSTVMSAACDNFRSSCIASFSGESIGEVGHDDVTDWFIAEYKEKGMCAYSDVNHAWITGDASQSSRVCGACGLRQVKKSKRVTKTWWEDENEHV